MRLSNGQLRDFSEGNSKEERKLLCVTCVKDGNTSPVCESVTDPLKLCMST